MRQFVLPPDWDGGPICDLSERDSRRLTSVLRLGPGDSFPAIGPDGSAYRCTIGTGTRGRVRLAVGRAAPGDPLPDIRAGQTRAGRTGPEHGSGVPDDQPGYGPSLQAGGSALPRIVLAAGMLKGSMFDDVVRAATEAGTAEVIPLATARTVVGQAPRGKLERWRRISAEALGQSGSGTPTSVGEPMTVGELCRAMPPAPGRRLCLFFHESPLAQGTLHRYCSGITEEMVLCVGPEGGFDDGEVALFLRSGFQPAWLGPTVLRAGTAAVFAIASVRIVCLERSSWSMIESKGFTSSGYPST